ncbi:MAG: glycosyltransferase [bacterium]|nr:glycosyltransferase [bacterium]
MKNVLIVTHSFPPLLEARSIQITKLVRHMESCGWRPVILTVDPNCTPIGQDPALCNLLPTGLRVIQTPAFEKQWAISLLVRTIPATLYLPDKQIGWRPYARRAAATILQEESIDLIFTNAKPFTCHLIGLDLKRQHKIPWVAYFSDPWVDNPYFQRISEWQIQYNRQMESDTLTEADGLVFNNPETATLMLHNRPPQNEACILPHCYDQGFFDLSRTLARPADPTGPPAGTFRIVHTGNFYGIRSPLPLLKALQEASKSTLPPVEVLLVGKIDPEHRRAIDQHGLQPFVRLIDSVGYLESLSYIQTAHLLVTIDAPVTEQSVFFPSKLVDYLGAAKPILGITPPGSTTDRILKENNQHVADVGNPEEIAAVLRNAIQYTSNRPAPEAYDAVHVTRSLARYFDTIGRLAAP